MKPNLIPCFLSVLVLLLAAATSWSAEMRTWTDQKGRTLEGILVEIDGEEAVILSKAGKEVRIKRSTLSAPDNKYHFFVAFDPDEKALRVMMLEQTTGDLIWDSGFIKMTLPSQTYGKLRFEAPGWIHDFNFDAAADQMYVQAGNVSSHLLGGWFKNVKIMH